MKIEIDITEEEKTKLMDFWNEKGEYSFTIDEVVTMSLKVSIRIIDDRQKFRKGMQP